MADQKKKDLQARIDRLEQRVAELEGRLTNLTGRDAPHSPASGERNEAVRARQSDGDGWELGDIQPGEEWLNRIGIGLLLIGTAFLFKYSIDRGWLIPPVRSAIGLGIGLTLFFGGLQMRPKQKPMKQILLGGGIAAFYITGFATFQFYTFMPGAIVWSFMIVVTLLALSLSLQQNEAVLSVVGTLGALGTPFMLYTGEGSVVSLMLYTALILVAAGSIYLKKGWRALLWSNAVGGLAVMAVAIINTVFNDGGTAILKQGSLQGGLLIWMCVSWLLPVAGLVLRTNNPRRWPVLEMHGSHEQENIRPYNTGAILHLMTFLIPLLGFILTVAIWEFSTAEAGYLSIGMAAFGGMLFLYLRRASLPRLSITHGFMGLVMLTIGFVLLLEGNFLFAVLLTETIALRYISYHTGDARIGMSSHLLYGIIVLWLLDIFGIATEGAAAIFDIESFIQLTAIAAGGTLIPHWLRKPNIRRFYQIASHLVLLIWLYLELSLLENGQAWITLAWGGYAIVLLLLGFVRFGKEMRLVGMATIFVVVGKLFLVDLSQLEAIWRILMFIGFGTIFLIIGYYWQTNWNEETGQKGT